MPPPEDKKGVERLSGFLNYVAKFIPDLSSITQPIRELIKEGMPVQLEPRTRNSFQKNDISTGAVLLQENKPIAYASRALTDTEKRYAQIEKQLLAVVYALEKFNQYVYGKTVQVESDHKPLESITKKSLCQANGLAEKSVQIIQSLLNKSKANNQDPYLSLLEYRNITVDNVGSSAQLLMGRKLRATLPVTASQLKPRIIPSEVVQRTLVQKRSTQKWYHDKGAKPLSELEKGDEAYMQVSNKWLPVVVTDVTKTPRSYVVKRPDGRKYRRNRKHLRAKYQVRNNHYNATKTQGETSKGRKDDGVVIYNRQH
ncbi:hypothetical protein EMCRGX_G012692 [Ephydatia muelleri]